MRLKLPETYTPTLKKRLHLVFWPMLYAFHWFYVYLNIIDQAYIVHQVNIIDKIVVPYVFINSTFNILIIIFLYLLYSKFVFEIEGKLNLKKHLVFSVFSYIIFYFVTIIIFEYFESKYPKFNNNSYVGFFYSFDLTSIRGALWYIVFMYLPPLFLAIFSKQFLAIYFTKARILCLGTLNKHFELSYLKSQIQPHFVFNMLNGVYALVVDQDDKASNTILKLSEVLRYNLYKANQPLISLKTEIDYLQAKIELEKTLNSNTFSEITIKIPKANFNIKPGLIASIFDFIKDQNCEILQFAIKPNRQQLELSVKLKGTDFLPIEQSLHQHLKNNFKVFKINVENSLEYAQTIKISIANAYN